jgi:hypothetical protein
VQTRAGLRIVPDRAAAAWPENLQVSAIGEPARALDRALLDIAARYGERTADVVSMQLEYPRGARRTD